MYRNVIRQQNLLTHAFLKIHVVCAVITLIISLIDGNSLTQELMSPENLIVIIFPRYLIFCGLIPTYLLALLATTQIRSQDILIYQSRKVVVLQVLYRLCLITIIMAGVWTVGTVLIMTVSHHFYFLAAIWLTILVRAVYLWTACFLLGMIAITLTFATKSKLIAFLISFSISALSFYLATATMPSLFFDFTGADTNFVLLGKETIMLGATLFFVAVMTQIIGRRDL
ncbi:hypothetical protein KTT66_10055 [Lacticaseibacillus casei]|uniref:ABC-2 type transport system permease protein n=1 Tax=Lacticaseibacillus huelsenbergensis TaxID=3035291 RepID=A0ABY8DSM7_9LACO|nr:MULTISPECIES: hypothetical protein [Lacticaseibacillus]MDG3062094.1 hypothetical protein [Lacticaseibacillus sp. BCRC 81376]QVI36738.1 hypothetical protein KGS74_10845 [Lacticaseibacillus casei]QXG58529.1 hypothetical protein KTT66_10055 [Lacticaseibacillus casei]WFB39999.1 hypothetical protein LHUE1_000769 [Lacticaseibacillus huelsenbergensis]WFB41731.1 hypothetical protein LHUE2_002593 [Lacticaseibacillus huelsenbergensis]